ncbi:hypothetical protein AHAS_Ahas13G0275500 [Arachis hypogaea]
MGSMKRTIKSFVRGNVINFSSRSIRQALHLPPSDHVFACYSERMHRDQQLDQVLEEICILGSQWRIGVEGKPNQLKITDLLPMARRWLDFIRRSIMPTSNRSKCTVDQAVMIHCIMKKRSGGATKVMVDYDFPIPIERPITKKTTEHLREHHRVSREDQVEEEAQQDHPSLPQGHYFSPQEYWEQLISSIEQMRITQDSH